MNNFNHIIRPQELAEIADFVLQKGIDIDFMLSMIYGTPSEPRPTLDYKTTTPDYRCLMLATGVADLLWERKLDMAMRQSAEWDRAILLCAIAAAREGHLEALDQVLESFQRQVRYGSY